MGGSPVTAAMQWAGRSNVLFAVVRSVPEVQTSSAVGAMILAWALSEVVRYPWYAAGTAGLNIPSTTGVEDPSTGHRVQYPRQQEAREIREGEEQEHPEMDVLIPVAAVGVPIAGVTSGIIPGNLNVEESPCKASNQIRQKSP